VNFSFRYLQLSEVWFSMFAIWGRGVEKRGGCLKATVVLERGADCSVGGWAYGKLSCEFI
jgi:hypothetical protein